MPVKGLLDKNYISGRAALIDPAHDMGTAVDRPKEYGPRWGGLADR